MISGTFSPSPRTWERRKKLLYTFNKIDLSGYEAGKPEPASAAREIYISAKTGAGIDELKREIKDIVAGSDFSENSFIAHTRHIDVLRTAGELLEQAAAQFRRTRAVELFADDLSRVQRTLGEITGEYTADDLLGEIFSRFWYRKINRGQSKNSEEFLTLTPWYYSCAHLVIPAQAGSQ